MSEHQPYIHPLADVQTTKVGAGTRLWQFVVALPGAEIGSDCIICSHCFIENDVVIGDRVTVKNGVQLWDGLRVGDDVFIGPNVTFTNDRYPRSRQHPGSFLQTHIDPGASIGGGATLVPGIRIGRNALVGAGAVVTRSIPPNAIVVGNPTRIVGYVDAKEHLQNKDSAKDLPAQAEGMGTRFYQLPRIIDIRGSLSAGEFEKSIPFAVKRYFLVFNVPSAETRGEHAHHACHQFLVCVHGSVSVVLDDGDGREEYILDRPDAGLYIPPMTWGIQYKYSADAVLLVFASHYYDADDYIRDYDEFLKLARNKA
ncbi:MAG: WxcM-like domain-containing protein [Burkholderiales bacterium]|nr:WxcM-like domain-containing protein [Burkholderiales bacterium]